jgi:hypothetical protein
LNKSDQNPETRRNFDCGLLLITPLFSTEVA